MSEPISLCSNLFENKPKKIKESNYNLAWTAEINFQENTVK